MCHFSSSNIKFLTLLFFKLLVVCSYLFFFSEKFTSEEPRSKSTGSRPCVLGWGLALLAVGARGQEGLSAAPVHASASYLLVSNSINFYAFIVFN